jgi:hypothetical protein
VNEYHQKLTDRGVMVMAMVLIEISGGVAAVTCNPDNVEVEIIDWDNTEAA